MRQEVRDTLINVVSLLSLVLTFIRFISEPTFETASIVLAALATVITVYVSKKRVERVENRYAIKPRQSFRTNIIVWGFKGSGKTWLCHAFGKALEQRYQNEINGLFYHIEKVDSVAFSDPPSAEFVPATIEAEDRILKFERARSVDKYSHTISSFQHYIRLTDIPGYSASSYVLRGEREPLLEENLINSDVVLITLDPTTVIDEHSLGLGFSPKNYFEFVTKTISLLEKRNGTKPYYAVCITKADMINGFYTYPPETLVEIFFGKELADFLYNFHDKKRLGIFSLSAVGFYVVNNKFWPNIDDNGHGLRKLHEWTPYGVEYPFFTAFEYIEKRLLEDKFKENWLGDLTLNSKIKKYIPYPRPNYESPEIQISKLINN